MASRSGLEGDKLGTYKRATSHPPYSQTQPSDHINEPSDVARTVRFRYRSAHCCWAAADHGANAEDASPRSPEPNGLFSRQPPSTPHVKWYPPEGYPPRDVFRFLDVAAHCVRPNDSTYVIVKVNHWTHESLEVDPTTIVPNARILLRK